MQPIIRISVESTSGTGKSAICQIIAEHMELIGIDAEYYNPEHAPRNTKTLQSIITNFRHHNLGVSIVEKQSKNSKTIEETLRKDSPAVKKAWEQYQIVLKLAKEV